MSNRRNFLKITGLGALASSALPLANSLGRSTPANKPIVISTWNHGRAANQVAWEILSKRGSALDAVETGVRVSESDPEISSVGYGGLPDREGNVTLDACIMDYTGNCGSVAFLKNIKNPISVARKVMEDTPHVMLAGQGASEFAREKGFEEEDLLTPEARKEWKKWLEKSEYKPIINIENHDTIGMIALDQAGNLAGACTTSGLAFKMHGRVGDSPLIGAGLFVDNEVGGAAATGVGEAVIKIAGSHLVVELMRQGHSPEKACELAVERIIARNSNYRELQVAFIALNKQGQYGAYDIQKGFNMAVKDASTNQMIDAKSKLM